MSPDFNPADGAAHFARKLAFETDPSDVAAALATGDPGFVFVDTRSLAAWEQGHARGAIHVPKPEMGERIPTYPAGTRFVVYCWGPGCNGATRAGLIISELGYQVQEMIGGFEYWAREGLPVDRIERNVVGVAATVDATRPADPLTAPLAPGSGQPGVLGTGLPGVGLTGAAVLFGGAAGGGAIACDC